MIDVSQKHPFDPLRDILDECDWDGTPRLSGMLTTYFGAEESKKQWAEAVSRRWMISAVSRVYERGCKADNVLVLEGTQGSFKSTALDILGLGYARELRVKLDDKDASDALHAGTWIAVLTELDAFKRTQRAESVKAFITMLEDHYRPSYGRVTRTFQRSIVFAATTNEESYLTDPTGNRRFWPIKCGRIDIPALRRDVEQLWAEAKQAYFDGEPSYLENGGLVALAEIEQAARVMPDSWEDYVEDYLRGKDICTVREVLEFALSLDASQQSPPNVQRVQMYLRRQGFYMTLRKGQKVYERKGER
jgi:predicted P-loop ATPase